MWNLKLMLILVFTTLFVLEANAQTSDDTSQYVLRVKTEPNILFIGGGGLYNAGVTVTLKNAPEIWQDYKFVGWKIDGIWTNENPPKIRMERNHEAVAVYEKSQIGKIVIDAIPRIAEITIDGTIYLPPELPISFDWETGSEHIISVPEIVKESTNTRYVFDLWKDNHPSNSRKILVDSDDSDFIALFETQHFFKPITEYGKILGGGWQNEGSTVNFEVESDVVIDKKNENIRYIFDSWNGGDYQNLPANSIDLEKFTTIKASWEKQYKLQIKTNVPGYDLFGTGWYNVGRQVVLISEEEYESDDANIKYAFEKWVSRGPNPIIIPNAHKATTTITVNFPYVIEAQYAKSYRVNVWTQYGDAEGAGFYKEGDIATIKMKKTEIEVKTKQIRKVFDGWNTFGARTLNLGDTEDLDLKNVGAVGNQNLLLFVNGPTNVTTNWRTQFYLDVQTSEAKAKGSGWYDLGRMVPISVSTPSTPPGMWSMYKFDRWVGDIDSTSLKERVIMNQPKTVIAEWREDNTPGIINSLILAGAVGIAAIVFTKTRKSNLLAMEKKKLQKVKEGNPFEKFFSTKKQPSKQDLNTPSFMEKQSKGKLILDWLLGR